MARRVPPHCLNDSNCVNRELGSGTLAALAAKMRREPDRIILDRDTLMTWTLWAVLLLIHGALSRWAKGSRFHAPASIVADGILIAIALITMEQLQDLEVLEVLRIGVFFIAFGTAGRQLMNSVLTRFPEGPPPNNAGTV
jgi:hypothetical protein